MPMDAAENENADARMRRHEEDAAERESWI
jgi:hypothetical protein